MLVAAFVSLFGLCVVSASLAKRKGVAALLSKL